MGSFLRIMVDLVVFECVCDSADLPFGDAGPVRRGGSLVDAGRAAALFRVSEGLWHAGWKAGLSRQVHSSRYRRLNEAVGSADAARVL